MRIVKYITLWTILIATMGMALNFIWPNTITYLTTRASQFDNAIYYVYDFKEYLRNIEFSAAKLTNLQLQMPERVWQTGAWELIGIVGEIGNNLAVILNYMILALNIIIYPFRIMSYVIQLLMAVIGFNMTSMVNNSFAWLKELTEWFIERFAIPYI